MDTLYINNLINESNIQFFEDDDGNEPVRPDHDLQDFEKENINAI